MKLEFAFTLEVWFSETPNTKSKRSIAGVDGVENFRFTVSVLTTNVFDSQLAHFDGQILIAHFSWLMLQITKQTTNLTLNHNVLSISLLRDKSGIEEAGAAINIY